MLYLTTAWPDGIGSVAGRAAGRATVGSVGQSAGGTRPAGRIGWPGPECRTRRGECRSRGGAGAVAWARSSQRLPQPLRRRAVAWLLRSVLDKDWREQRARAEAGAYFDEIATGSLTPNPRQPRQVFDEESLEELAASIRVVGLLQPVVVRAVMHGHYEIVMGERRWRACQQQARRRDYCPAGQCQRAIPCRTIRDRCEHRNHRLL